MLGLWNLQITYLNQWYDRIVLNKLRLSSILFSVWSSSSTFTNIMSMVVMPMSMPSPSYLIILASSSEEHHQKNILETVNPLLSLRPLPSNVYLRKNNTKYYTVESLKSGQLCRKLSRNSYFVCLICYRSLCDNHYNYNLQLLWPLYCQSQPQLKLSLAKIALISLSTINFLIRSPRLQE